MEEHDPASSGNSFSLLNVLKAGNIQSAAPIAIPLEQKKIVIGTNVQLDGSTSFDPDGDELVSYQWTVDVAPGGSTASLTNSTNASASFTPDVAGYYKIGLTVNDGALNSVKQRVTLHAVATNAKPVADAGSDVFVTTKKYTYLNGTNSSDADNDTMTFKWSVLSQPAGSSEQVINDATPEPYFRPRQEGEFLIGLVVNDSIENSDVDTIIITAIDNYTSIKLNTSQEFKIYPNPSSGKLTMDYILENTSNVLIAVYSLDGKKLTALVDEKQGQGNHQLKCDLNSFTVKGNYYILEFRVNDQVRTETFLVK